MGAWNSNMLRFSSELCERAINILADQRCQTDPKFCSMLRFRLSHANVLSLGRLGLSDRSRYLISQSLTHTRYRTPPVAAAYSYTTHTQTMVRGKHPHVAVVGVGGVGTQVIEQMIANPIYGFQLVAFCSSKRMLISAADVCLNPVSWKDALNASPTPVDFSAVQNALQELAKRGETAVFVDNTSSQDVAEMYPGLLGAGINVVTPNKKAFSGEAELYRGIVQEGDGRGRYLYESTVGAGLPIISTLRDLVETGDKVGFCSCGAINKWLTVALRSGPEDRRCFLRDHELHLQQLFCRRGKRRKLFLDSQSRPSTGVHGMNLAPSIQLLLSSAQYQSSGTQPGR